MQEELKRVVKEGVTLSFGASDLSRGWASRDLGMCA